MHTLHISRTYIIFEKIHLKYYRTITLKKPSEARQSSDMSFIIAVYLKGSLICFCVSLLKCVSVESKSCSTSTCDLPLQMRYINCVCQSNM